MSPTEYSSCSSRAEYFLAWRTVFLSTGCVKRRSTRTTTVFFGVELTTVPCSMRLGIKFSLLRLRALLLRDRLDPGDIAPHDAYARAVLKLTGGALEAQVE